MCDTAFRFEGFDHLKWSVGNAKQAADWYIMRFGFKYLAYRGLETGEKDVVSHVICQNKIIWEFMSPYNPIGMDDMKKEYAIRGDAVKDIALQVDDARATFNFAKTNGAIVVAEPYEIADEFGTVVLATVRTYGDVNHTFVDRKNYTGPFLPGYRTVERYEPFDTFTEPINIIGIDHVVGNQPDNEVLPVVEWYEKKLNFHRFWSVDDSVIHSEFSSLRSTVVSDASDKIKLPLNEPANGRRKSQIQEFVDYYGGAGVQHIALRTNNIIHSLTQLKARGVKFLSIPSTYYDQLRERLKLSNVKIEEDLNKLEELNILVDYDDDGYLLQIFTSPCQDRPTLFLEIIQRNNFDGFGAGNFKSLFSAIEAEQALRGNL